MPITAKELRALVKSFPWDDWNKELQPEMKQVYRDLVETSGKVIGKDHGVSFDMNDPFLQEHMTGYIGERVTQLSRTSKKDVIRAVVAALKSNKEAGPAELQEVILNAVRQKYEGYEAWRALRIARAESAIAYNHGNVLGSAQAGFQKVDVIDGTDDEECAAANGAVWGITKALNNPIAHPNCIRAMTPHVGEDEDD